MLREQKQTDGTLIRRYADILTAEQEAALRDVGSQVAGVSQRPEQAHVGEALQALMRGERRRKR
jgi:hypothetical protein